MNFRAISSRAAPLRLANEVTAKVARSPYGDHYQPPEGGFTTLRPQFQLPAHCGACNMTSPCLNFGKKFPRVIIALPGRPGMLSSG